MTGPRAPPWMRAAFDVASISTTRSRPVRSRVTVRSASHSTPPTTEGPQPHQDRRPVPMSAVLVIVFVGRRGAGLGRRPGGAEAQLLPELRMLSPEDRELRFQPGKALLNGGHPVGPGRARWRGGGGGA